MINKYSNEAINNKFKAVIMEILIVLIDVGDEVGMMSENMNFVVVNNKGSVERVIKNIDLYANKKLKLGEEVFGVSFFSQFGDFTIKNETITMITPIRVPKYLLGVVL